MQPATLLLLCVVALATWRTWFVFVCATSVGLILPQLVKHAKENAWCDFVDPDASGATDSLVEEVRIPYSNNAECCLLLGSLVWSCVVGAPITFCLTVAGDARKFKGACKEMARRNLRGCNFDFINILFFNSVCMH